MSGTERAARAHEILSAALDAPPAERGTLLDRLCDDDAELRAWVESLLRADATRHALLDATLDLTALLIDDGDAVGRQVGAYRIVGEIGRGGMGVVYLAERADGEYEHRVALKVIRDGPDADALAERFRRERQILAMLQHPNIAQLHDGGRSPEGHPFLAMEYVDGVRIDRYADEHGLGIDERVRLFRTACGAVDHAHRNLVVHRDLKPAHIVVTPDGIVKLLDFGIAKLLPRDEATGEDTRTALLAFTPRYSSPEQLRGGATTVATDVYALGVILYELLSGQTPFPEGDDPFETARARLEDDPPLPSAVAPATIRRQLRGELDAIVLRALRKAPAERYATAALLADDLGRWLRHEPVTARPDRVAYRVRKFIRRHRAGVVTAAGLLVATAGVGTFHVTRVTDERDRAELEARKASEVRDFLLGLFTSSYPQRTLGDTLRVADLLEHGVARADSLDAQPVLRALLLTTLGDVFRVLGRYDRAMPLLEQSLEVYRAMADPPALDLAGALTSMATLHYELQQHDVALPLTREALAIQQRELGDDHPDVITSLNNLAATTSGLGRADEALEIHRDVLERRRRLLGHDHATVAVTLNNMGALALGQQRYEEAEEYLAGALELRRRLLDRAHPDLALSMNNLASLYRQLERFAEAEPLYREALEIRQQVLGEDHPRVAVSHYNLGRLLHMKGDLDAAEPHLRAALAIDRTVYAADHPEIAVDAYQLGMLLADRNDCDAARPLFLEAAAVFDRHGPARADQAARARAAVEACP